MDEVRGKRVLVTGCSGFVGTNLVREFVCRGSEVHGLIRPGTDLWRIKDILPRLTLHSVDVTNADEVKKTVRQVRPQIIFHLAARRVYGSDRHEFEILNTNLLGTFHLLEATGETDYDCFVYLGSSTEYGTKVEAMREDDFLEPVTFFGVTKAAATLLCQQFARRSQLPLIILRSFPIYGYWDSPKRLISKAIGAALNNSELPLTPPGYRRDFIFIEDLMEACLLALKTRDLSGEIINIASGKQTANEEVVDLIQELTSREIKVRVASCPPRAHDKTFWVGDIRKAKKLLGWKPRHTMRDGLEKTIAWYRIHKDEYDAFYACDR
jgi:nucleoside-diphosphate-sugar epimerase